MQETQIQSLGQEDSLEKEMATPVFLPGKSHDQKCLAGCRPGVQRESDTTEQPSAHTRAGWKWIRFCPEDCDGPAQVPSLFLESPYYFSFDLPASCFLCEFSVSRAHGNINFLREAFCLGG